MDIEIVKTCPLGSKCREIKDGKIYECMWYMHIKGMNPQTGEEVDEYNCSIAWTPLLLLENAKHIRGVAAATEDFRNKMVEGQGTLTNLSKLLE